MSAEEGLPLLLELPSETCFEGGIFISLGNLPRT